MADPGLYDRTNRSGVAGAGAGAGAGAAGGAGAGAGGSSRNSARPFATPPFNTSLLGLNPRAQPFATTTGPTSTAGAGPSHATPKIRRRNRMITSCLECRRRKLKCNKTQPCVNCVKFSRDCLFLATSLDQASQLKLMEIKEKVGSLERLLERDVARPAASASASASPPSALLHRGRGRTPGDDEEQVPGAEEEDDLEVTPLAVMDAAYDDNPETNDDLLDLGIQLGKMRINERIGGFFRPKMSQEVGRLSATPFFLLCDSRDLICPPCRSYKLPFVVLFDQAFPSSP